MCVVPSPIPMTSVLCSVFSQVVLKPAFFLSFQASDSACSSAWESSVLHPTTVSVQESASLCLLPSSRKSQECSSLPKLGSCCWRVPFPWGLTQTPHYCLPNTQRHQGHKAFFAVTLELTPTPSILVKCLISGHNV